MIKKLINIALVVCFALALPARAINNDLEEIVVVGSKEDVSSVPGSGISIDIEQLERFDYTDLHQVLSGVPGIM